MVTTPQADWRKLAEAAHREQDPQRLMELIALLKQALDEPNRPGQPDVCQNWG